MTTKPDAGSLVVSYLWGEIGNLAMKAELELALLLNHEQPKETTLGACRRLAETGWVDLFHHVEDGLPAVRLTPEAVEALHAHVQGGSVGALPERLERARDRDARVARQGADAQVRHVELLEQLRDEAVAQRRENAELRRMILEDRQARALPGPAPAPVRTYVACGCGGGNERCRTCGGTGRVAL